MEAGCRDRQRTRNFPRPGALAIGRSGVTFPYVNVEYRSPATPGPSDRMRSRRLDRGRKDPGVEQEESRAAILTSRCRGRSRSLAIRPDSRPRRRRDADSLEEGRVATLKPERLSPARTSPIRGPRSPRVSPPTRPPSREGAGGERCPASPPSRGSSSSGISSKPAESRPETSAPSK